MILNQTTTYLVIYEEQETISYIYILQFLE